MDAQPLFFNPLEDGYSANPWPHLAEMRLHDPVHHSILENWVLFRYVDVAALLRDPTLSVDEDNITVHDEERLAIAEAAFGDEEWTTSMLGKDPPDHTRLRRLVSKAFTPSASAALQPVIDDLVETALDKIDERGSCDVVADLGYSLPFEVMTALLGMPVTEGSQLAAWSSSLVKNLDPTASEAELHEAADAGRKINALLEEVIAWKRANPGDDLLTAMIAVEEDGDRLTSIELRDQVQLLFVAGHETTGTLISSGLYELLRRPEQAAILRDDPSLDAGAVDELLRFVSPVQFSRRITLKPIEIDGNVIAAGTYVMAGIASANHDPAKFGDDADEVDVRRPEASQHIAFGSGSHYCLGASLGKLQAQAAIGGFLRRFPAAQITGQPVWNTRIVLRGLERLDVAVR